MSRLLRVELRRYRARRITLWVTLGVLAVVALSTVAAGITARPPSDAELTQAQAWYEDARADWEANGEQMVADCLEAQEADPDPQADYGCEQMEPRLEHFLPVSPDFFPADAERDAVGDWGTAAADPQQAERIAQVRSSLWNFYGGIGVVDDLAPVLLFATFLVAVSFVTAELSSGAVGLWLTFEPRRPRVFWSKAGAATLASLPVVVGGFALLAAGSYGAYALFDAVGEPTGAAWREVAAYTGRLAVAGVLVSAVGVSLGMLLRHAAAALGVAAAWVGAENVFRWSLGTAQQWAVTTNLSAWLRGGEVYSTNRCSTGDDGTYVCESVDHLVTQTQGGLYLGALTVVLVLVALVVFRRRDVA